MPDFPTMTISELEARVKTWKSDASYNYGRSWMIARATAMNNMREALLLATRNGHSLTEIIAELDKERT